jgi:predicted MFS family arabinose efflux permease
LPASVANTGVAFGSVAGGVTIDLIDTRAVTLTGLTIAVAAALVAVLIRTLRPPTANQTIELPAAELVAA